MVLCSYRRCIVNSPTTGSIDIFSFPRYQPLHILHQILTYFTTKVIKLVDLISAVCSDYLIWLGQRYVFYYKIH